MHEFQIKIEMKIIWNVQNVFHKCNFKILSSSRCQKHVLSFSDTYFMAFSC